MLEYLNIKKEMTAAVGNDFNDTDMLEEAGMSFVVANSPEKMKSKFKNVSSCEESGFSQAVEEFISEVFTNLNNSKICRKPIPARNE
jgi:hydroxymethylpyrimidine pyrophosphatase-like HAD family hydrolase